MSKVTVRADELVISTNTTDGQALASLVLQAMAQYSNTDKAKISLALKILSEQVKDTSVSIPISGGQHGG